MKYIPSGCKHLHVLFIYIKVLDLISFKYKFRTKLLARLKVMQFVFSNTLFIFNYNH